MCSLRDPVPLGASHFSLTNSRCPTKGTYSTAGLFRNSELFTVFEPWLLTLHL